MKIVEHRKKIEYKQFKTPEHGAESPFTQQEIQKALKLADESFNLPNVILTEKKRNFDAGIRLQANTSELVVSTSLKKLTAYVFAVTQKSPKKFRGTLVKYLQDKCIEAIENVIKANSTKRTTKESIEQRKNFQQNAYANLKIISYLSFVSTGFACLTKKQYEQIATMVADSLNLLVAWRKSDAGNVPFLSANKDETQ